MTEAKKDALVLWALRRLAGPDDEPMPDIEGLTRGDLNDAHVEVGRRIGVGLANAQARIKISLSEGVAPDPAEGVQRTPMAQREALARVAEVLLAASGDLQRIGAEIMRQLSGEPE
jgi:hypothetical protein